MTKAFKTFFLQSFKKYVKIPISDLNKIGLFSNFPLYSKVNSVTLKN